MQQQAASHSPSGAPVYLPHNGHWSAFGHKLGIKVELVFVQKCNWRSSARRWAQPERDRTFRMECTGAGWPSQGRSLRCSACMAQRQHDVRLACKLACLQPASRAVFTYRSFLVAPANLVQEVTSR
ncbi:hypothetical protein ABPG75_000856 [Micractinium tetrahymenae]